MKKFKYLFIFLSLVSCSDLNSAKRSNDSRLNESRPVAATKAIVAGILTYFSLEQSIQSAGNAGNLLRNHRFDGDLILGLLRHGAISGGLGYVGIFKLFPYCWERTKYVLDI